jgi:uncharacterized protein YggE
MSKATAVSQAIIGIMLVSSLCLGAETREKESRTITVQGQGKVSAIPDIASLSVEVSREGADLDSVLTQVRKEMNKVLDALRGQGIAEKDVQTELFQVHPKYEQDRKGNSHRAGFVVTNRAAVKVRDLKKAGKVLASVLNAGATTVDGPDFELDNPAVAEREALASATKDAQAKAQAVAEAADVKLGELLSINPENVSWPVPRRPLMMRAMALPAAAEAEEPLSAGEQTLTGNVTVTYAIR